MHKYLNRKLFHYKSENLQCSWVPIPGIKPLHHEWGLGKAGSSGLFEHSCLKVSLCYAELRWVGGVGQGKHEKVGDSPSRVLKGEES